MAQVLIQVIVDLYLLKKPDTYTLKMGGLSCMCVTSSLSSRYEIRSKNG